MTFRLLALLTWFLLQESASAQGQINLNNRGLAQVFDASGKPITGTSFVAQIWYGPSANSLTQFFALSPFRASTTTFPGTWNPSATGGPGAIGTLTGFPPGSTVTMRVAVWDSAISGVGAYQAFNLTPGTGLSEPFTYAIPPDPLAIPGGMGNMRPFSLVTAGGLAQAAINLNNRGLALVNDAAGKPLTGTSFVAQVWYGPSASSLTKFFAPSPFRASTTTYPGTWNPAATGGPGAYPILTGFAPGSTVTIRVAVWDSAIAGVGAAEAFNRTPGTGLSEPFTYTIPPDPLAIPGGMENLQPFSLIQAGGLTNRPPSAIPQTVNVSEDGSLSIILYGSDPEGAPLTHKIIKQPINGSLSYRSGALTYLPKLGYEGEDSFTFIVNDSVNNSEEAAVLINVLPKPEIMSAFWSTPNGESTCYSGTTVTLFAEVKGFNITDKIAFRIIESDPILDDGIITVDATFFEFNSKTYASATWVSQWVYDGGGNPEYYFTAFGRELTSAKSPLLLVIPSDIDDKISSANVFGNINYSIQTNSSIELPDDVDFYQINALAGQTITFDVDKISGSFTPMLRLFNSKGLEITNNVGQIAPLEKSTNEAFIRFNFSDSGEYYVGVSGAGNAKYNPLSGRDDLPGSYGSYRFTVSSGFASHVTRADSTSEYLVDICREDKVGYPIDSTKNTWVIIHGWNSSRTESKISNLVKSVIIARPSDQVLTLDWSSLADTGYFNIFSVLLLDPTSQAREAAKGIAPTGKWAATILQHYGLSADKINVIGHSFGCYVADQLADGYQPEKLRSIVALDPAANAVPGAFNPEIEVNFLVNSIWSWVFHSSDLGSDFVPSLASESFIVRTGLDLVSAHLAVLNFFSDLLVKPLNFVTSLFNLNRLSSGDFGPWVLNQFYSPFKTDRNFLVYEATINAPDGVVASVEYIANAPAIFVDYPADNSVVRDRVISVGGRASDFDRGNSGVSSVVVNGSISTGGVSSDVQTAFWSNTVAMKLGTNTMQVVATDASATNPGKATNSVVVKYQPEFIDLPSQAFDELALASLDLAVDDKVLSDRVLSHSLKSGPVGLSVTASGRLAWVPTEAQGPSTNLVEVAITDGFVGTTKRVVIVVREVNTPPSLKAVPDSTLAAGVEWLVGVEGTDSDLPVQQLAYTLKASPAGMTINQVNGTIRWTPSRAQGPGTYPVTVSVADSVGAVVEQSFRVSVSGPAQRPTLAISSANPNGTISLQIRAEQGLVVDLEHSGDLNTWVLAQQITGQTMDQPVKLVLPTDPNTQAVFWRLRLR